jgi:hypothetical protein
VISTYPAESPEGSQINSVEQGDRPHPHLVKDRRSFKRSNLGGGK